MMPVWLYIGIIIPMILVAQHTAYSETVQIVTQRGNVFVLEDSNPSVNGTDNSDGTSMIDGLGINSRLLHRDYDGSVMYGKGLVGTEESIGPYHTVDSETGFIVAMLGQDNTQTINIPEFYQRYTYDGALVRTSTNTPNILGHADSRTINGDMQVSLDDGVTVTGTGRIIVELSDYSNQTLILSGHLSNGTNLRFVQSPYDLMVQEYIQDKGFLINYCACNPGRDTMSVFAGSVDDSIKSGTFKYDQKASASAYHGKCCKGRHTAAGTIVQTVESDLILRAHENGYHEIIGDANNPVTMNIRDVMHRHAKLFRINFNIVENFHHWTYDTLPVKESMDSLHGAFEVQFTFPSGVSYMIIDSVGGVSKISGTALVDRNFIDVRGLEPDTGYRLVRDGHTISLGMTAQDGRIRLPAFEDHVFSDKGGRMYLYGDSMAHLKKSGSLGMVAFDHINEEKIALPWQGHGVYNIHAYVKIPVTGQNDITETNLDKRLYLEYLDGTYGDGQSIFVPIIPTYKRINFEINGVQASLNVADVLGGTGLKIADPVTSEITISSPDDFTHSVESTAGAIAYMIASSDGNAKAHIQASISGESEITNVRKYLRIPPPPPPPLPRDPLTAWVEVYINGQLHQVNGQDRTQIFFSDTPIEDHDSGIGAYSAYHTARFSYPSVTVFDTISVPVREADFVEFYFYNKIYAEGSIPPIPSGHVEYQRSSEASASTTIRYASINTSM